MNSAKRVVIKLGGKALSSGERIKNLAEKVVSEIRKKKQVAVVVSAMGETTDTLIERSLKACRGKISQQDLDEILSMGERTSARLFAAALRAHGIKTRFFDPSDSNWPIITDSKFGNANPLTEQCSSKIRSTILPLLEKGVVPVLPGFIGKTLRGEVTTLGRGGSDTTAFLLARAIKAEEVVIVTDVNGIMTADPKIVPNSRKIEKIDVRKLMNICDSGTKFLHRKALRCLDGSFRVRIMSYKSKGFNDEGTVINGFFPKKQVSIGCNSPAAMVTIVGKGLVTNSRTLSDVIMKIKRHKISVLAWLADFDSLCVYVPEAEAEKAAEAVHSIAIKSEEGLAISVRKDLALIRIFGVEIESIPYILKKVIESLEKRNINVFGTSTIASNIHIFVEWMHKDNALSIARDILKNLRD